MFRRSVPTHGQSKCAPRNIRMPLGKGDAIDGRREESMRGTDQLALFTSCGLCDFGKNRHLIG